MDMLIDIPSLSNDGALGFPDLGVTTDTLGEGEDECECVGDGEISLELWLGLDLATRGGGDEGNNSVASSSSSGEAGDSCTANNELVCWVRECEYG